jgi:hypothetical protein
MQRGEAGPCGIDAAAPGLLAQPLEPRLEHRPGHQAGERAGGLGPGLLRALCQGRRRRCRTPDARERRPDGGVTLLFDRAPGRLEKRLHRRARHADQDAFHQPAPRETGLAEAQHGAPARRAKRPRDAMLDAP